MTRRLLLVAAITLAAGCFNVDKPICSYSCADSDPRCPDDYECRSDGYCHLTGSTEACAFSDAATSIDMSGSVPGDLSGADMTTD
jgi:hypothetical protein